MSTHEPETGASENSDTTSHVQIAVWFTTNKQVPDGFAIEIIDREVWKPEQVAWEVEHTFEGLIEDAPYTLRIHPGDPDSEHR